MVSEVHKHSLLVLSCLVLSVRVIKLCPSMTRVMSEFYAHAHLIILSSNTVPQDLYFSGGGVVPVNNCMCVGKGVLVRCGSCCYVEELGNVDGGCSCVDLTQVVTDGDCHPATYEPS